MIPVREALFKFYQGSEFDSKRKKKLNAALKKTLNGSRFRDYWESFRKINKLSNSIKRCYQNGCEYLVNTILKVYFFNTISSRAREIQQKKRSVAIISQTLDSISMINSSIHRWNTSLCFSLLLQFSEFKAHNQRRSHQRAIKLI